jgi:hypothetical protein
VADENGGVKGTTGHPNKTLGQKIPVYWAHNWYIQENTPTETRRKK